MIAYVMTSDECPEGIVLVDADTADAGSAEVARNYYCEQMAAQGIRDVKAVALGVSAMFEHVTLFKMPQAEEPSR